MRAHDDGPSVPMETAARRDERTRRLFDAVREVQHRPQPPFWGSVGRRAEQGSCNVLATLIHERVGGEFIAIVEEGPRKDVMQHVAVLVDGRVLDGRGSTELSSWVADAMEEARGDPRTRVAIVPEHAIAMHLGAAPLRDEEGIATLAPLADAVVAARFTDERLWRGVVPQSKGLGPDVLTNVVPFDVLMARPVAVAPDVDVEQLRLAPGLIEKNADFSLRTPERAFEDRIVARRDAIAAGWRGSPEVVSPARHAALDAAGGFDPEPRRTVVDREVSAIERKPSETMRSSSTAAATALALGLGR